MSAFPSLFAGVPRSSGQGPGVSLRVPFSGEWEACAAYHLSIHQ